MRHFIRLFVIIILTLSPLRLLAQMDISAPVRRVSVAAREEALHTFEVKDEYFSLARYRAEKIEARRARNELEISPGLEASLNTLNTAWIETSGGANTISATSTLYIKHKYTKGLLSVTTSLSAAFGYYRMNVERTNEASEVYDEGVWYKNQDEFNFSISPSLSMTKNWSYGATLTFRSQFANGYVSSSSQESIHLKSGFLSPGYLTLSLGLNYQCPKERFPLKVTISPLALNGIFVKSEAVRENALYQYLAHEEGNWKYTDPYGVSPYESSKSEGGSSVQIDYDYTFGKRATVRYVTSIFSFYGWISNVAYSNLFWNYGRYEEAVDEWDNTSKAAKPLYAIKPTVRWTNRIELKATRLLYTNINFELYYDRAQNEDIQTKTVISLGLSYKFTNKN